MPPGKLRTLEKRFAGALLGAVSGGRPGREPAAASPGTDPAVRLTLDLARHLCDAPPSTWASPSTARPLELTIPLGLWLHEDLETVPEISHEVFSPADPGGETSLVASATLAALAVGYVVSRESVAATDMTDVLMRGVMNLDTVLMEKVDGVLALVNETAAAVPSAWVGIVELDAPPGERPETAVLPALYAFLRCDASFAEATSLLHSWGSDAAGVRGRLAGALCGAFRGMDALPEDAGEGVDEVILLGRDLYRATQRLL